MRTDQLAAQTWDRIESLEDTNSRIHDGAAGEAALQERADRYVASLLFGSFPGAAPQTGADILEIGSGVGWIMQAMNGYLTARGRAPRLIVGLDIAANMLAKARARLGDRRPFEFLHYDGITVPLADDSLDLIYSVAALQHVPRPYVFNLFIEAHRLLRRGASAVMHFMSTDCLPGMEPLIAWRDEIRNQITGAESHWHHYYTRQELESVLAITGFASVSVADDGQGCLVACARK